MWRKLLALRVMVICGAILVLALYLSNFLDSPNLGLPDWLHFLPYVPAATALFGFAYAASMGLSDMVVHFVPTVAYARRFLPTDLDPEQIALSFGQTGYKYALVPFFALALLSVVILAFGLVIGGIAALVTIWAAVGSAVSSWPTWAVVITVLLILVLLKR